MLGCCWCAQPSLSSYVNDIPNLRLNPVQAQLFRDGVRQVETGNHPILRHLRADVTAQ
jgi:hypothetical protein